MDTTYIALRSKQAIAPVKLGPGLFGSCISTLLAWREQERIRAALSNMGDRELHDIGIARGEIDYVASNRTADPRGAV